ncbi:hypothetical protein WKK05_10370 [Nostoc sp. UHCC 0302]|uniref:hypothetical protein n=1 Tax=Nostoc sp. UHCC 0302 TaxID=3134896 RepID=UPI00311CC960
MNSPFPLDPPQSALKPLLVLRDHYAPLVEQYEKLYTQAKDNLSHIEALLSSWDLSATSNATVTTNKTESAPADSFFSVDTIPEQNTNVIESISPDAINNLLLDEESDAVTDTPPLPEPPALPLIETVPLNQQRSLYGVEIPMLPQYQSLSRAEAIKKVLQEHIGAICHIDFIVKLLYGDLEPDVFKLVKSRVQSSLTQGRESNKWYSIPDQPGCYTLNLSLLVADNHNAGSSITKAKKNKQPLTPPKPKVIPMLKAFEGQFLIDALSTFLQQNAQKAFHIDEIVNGVYGKLNAADFREVKVKVQNELSRGYRTGRFSRVPDKFGFYTWDKELIN